MDDVDLGDEGLIDSGGHARKDGGPFGRRQVGLLAASKSPLSPSWLTAHTNWLVDSSTKAKSTSNPYCSRAGNRPGHHLTKSSISPGLTW